MKKVSWFYRAAAFAVVAISLMLCAPSARGQAPAFSGALIYSEARQTSVPPIYSGQPAPVTAAYLWLDDLMRLDQTYQILVYIKSLSWNDTAKTIASYLYQIQDDNPLSYYSWDDAGIYPHPYKANNGQAEFAFINKAWQIGGTLSGVLLSSEIISDVTISDTVCKKVLTSYSSSDQVLVNCVINDEINGKFIPGCPSLLRTRKKGALPQSDTTPITPVYADTASAGTCLQFDYSPEWPLLPGDDTHSTSLKDSAGGWWIKPGQEYIVFLNFIGIGTDGTLCYFSTYPVSFGHEGGMYPVVDGYVQDPHDDFRLGGTHFTVSEWKTLLRAKIYSFTHP